MARKESRDAARRYLLATVETYDHYLMGQVYGYETYSPTEEEDEEGELIDSCYGYYEDPQGYPLEEARRAVDVDIRHEQEKLAEMHITDMAAAGALAFKSSMAVL